MHFAHPDGSTIRLAYCSNVHPAQDVAGIVAQLRRFAGPVRQRLGVDCLGVGLWLPVTAVDELAEDAAALPTLVATLDEQRLEVFTLNGFPYRDFQAPAVKYGVYRPDWAEPERRDYTLRLAGLLSELLPPGVDEGSISTLPWMWPDRRTTETWAAACSALEEVAIGLEKLEAATGRRVRLAVEPEPGCAAQTTAEAVEVLRGLAPEWIGLCIDSCHLAVQFEDPAEAVSGARGAGVPVVKAQISCALRAPDPRAAGGWLAGFVEPRFLHQTRELRPDGGLFGVDDLDSALAGGLPGRGEWRVHFHVPVHSGEHTTQASLISTLEALAGGARAITTHLEVETYTWGVLPAGQRPVDDDGLIDGLASELRWTADQLSALGLEELS